MTEKNQTSKPAPKAAAELTDEALDQVAGGRKAGEGQKDWTAVAPKDPGIVQSSGGNGI